MPSNPMYLRLRWLEANEDVSLTRRIPDYVNACYKFAVLDEFGNIHIEKAQQVELSGVGSDSGW
jgi:hypothetical protein